MDWWEEEGSEGSELLGRAPPPAESGFTQPCSQPLSAEPHALCAQDVSRSRRSRLLPPARYRNSFRTDGTMVTIAKR